MRTRWGRRAMSYSESVLSTHGFLSTFVGIYIIINILLFLREALGEAARHENYRRYVTAVARGSGGIINFNSAVVLLLASRSTLGVIRTTPLNMVLPIDKAMPEMHRIVGILILFAAILHTCFHLPYYFINHPWAPGLTGATSIFFTGVLLLTALLTIRLVARPAVLQSNYELFFRTHVGGSIIMYALLVVHGMHNTVPNTWKYIIGPVIIYTLDVAFRSFREKRSYLLLSKHSAACQGQNIVKIRLPRVFHYEAGQYAEIKVPHLSFFQWHPFTIASAPHEPEIVFYIKAVGNWTQSLYQLFSNRSMSHDGNDIEIHIRGPYGAPAQHVGQFDRVILIGGGVGATPFCSVVKDAHYWIKNWIPRQLLRERGGNEVGNSQAGSRNSESSPQTDDLSRECTVSVNKGSQDRDTENLEVGKKTQRRSTPESQSSHLFTTNFYSEGLGSERSVALGEPIRSLPRRDIQQHAKNEVRSVTSTDSGKHTVGQSTMYTARDFLGPIDNYDQEPSIGSHIVTELNPGSQTILDIENGGGANIDGFEDSEQMTDIMAKDRRSQSRARRTAMRNNVEAEDGMGTYYENSVGSHHYSLDYLTALHSVLDKETNETFQKSLDMMVGMSFGSVSLVRNIQIKKAQKHIRQGRTDLVPNATTEVKVDMFRNPWIMFLLYMRSVTANMLILWMLILRFTIAGATFTVTASNVFGEGVQLYKQPALNAIDLVIGIVLVIFLGVPSIVEIFQIGAAPLHGFDMFVLTPIALFGVVIDIMALRRVGRNVDAIFTVFHVFLVWPVLAILVLVRLLRVIGERITQVESLKPSHSTTRAVDFFWTAPTAEDDRWLVGELINITDRREVRLHRYLTRAIAAEGEENKRQVQYAGKHTGSLQTNFGRPNWHEIFNEVAERSRNNTTIGVFFCGPMSMARDVQTACMEAMRNSIIRGLQSGARAMRGLEEVFGDAITANEYTGDVGQSSYRGNERSVRGCNVTIVFKRESFS